MAPETNGRHKTIAKAIVRHCDCKWQFPSVVCLIQGWALRELSARWIAAARIGDAESHMRGVVKSPAEDVNCLEMGWFYFLENLRNCSGLL